MAENGTDKIDDETTIAENQQLQRGNKTSKNTDPKVLVLTHVMKETSADLRTLNSTLWQAIATFILSISILFNGFLNLYSSITLSPEEIFQVRIFFYLTAFSIVLGAGVFAYRISCKISDRRELVHSIVCKLTQILQGEQFPETETDCPEDHSIEGIDIIAGTTWWDLGMIHRGLFIMTGLPLGWSVIDALFFLQENPNPVFLLLIISCLGLFIIAYATAYSRYLKE